MKFTKTLLFTFLFLTSAFSMFAQTGDKHFFSKHNVYSVRNLYKATLCVSDSNFIPFTKIDTLGSALYLNINLDSLKILKPGKLSYINFQLKNDEACVIPVKIWIKTISKTDKNNVDDTQYIEQNVAFLNSSNNYVSFDESLILKNNIYEIVIKFYAVISKR